MIGRKKDVLKNLGPEICVSEVWDDDKIHLVVGTACLPPGAAHGIASVSKWTDWEGSNHDAALADYCLAGFLEPFGLKLRAEWSSTKRIIDGKDLEPGSLAAEAYRRCREIGKRAKRLGRIPYGEASVTLSRRR